MTRGLLLCCLAALPLPAELTISMVRDNAEIQLTSQAQLPSTAVGDTLDTLVRVRNTGSGNTPVTVLAIAGSGFSEINLPELPAVLPPDAYLDFTVRFQPSIAASYSALLRADGVNIFVLAGELWRVVAHHGSAVAPPA